MKTEGLLHITISVTDMDRAKAFYEDILGFETYHMNPRGTMCFMNAGKDIIVLTSMEGHFKTRDFPEDSDLPRLVPELPRAVN